MGRVASIAVLGALGLVCLATGRPDPQRRPRIGAVPFLDVRIGAARAAEYQAIRDGRDWRNPYLEVTSEGFRLRSLSLPEPRSVLPAELRRLLTELPVSDWPVGRVVVVQSPSIVPSDESWIAAMERNVEAAKRIVTALDVAWWAWPA
jgi:hypothetical protein